MTVVDIDSKELKLAAATFAGFKLDMEKALMVDHRLSPSAYRVASCLLQFMNGGDGRLFPAIETIAETTGIKERTVRYSLAELRDTGWLDWHRGNRQLANEYAFNIDNLEPMLAKRREMERARSIRKKSRQPTILTGNPLPLGAMTQARLTGNPLPLGAMTQARLTGNPLPLATGNPVPTNTLREHLSKRAAK